MKKISIKFFSGIFGVFTPVRILVITFISVFLGIFILSDNGIYQIHRLLDMKRKLSNEQVKLNDEIDQLNKEKDVLSDPDKLEPIIRSELGYIKPGEIIFEGK